MNRRWMILLAVFVAATSAFGCGDSTGPTDVDDAARRLNGTWYGSEGGRTLQLTLTAVSGTALLYGVEVDSHVLTFNGSFSDAELQYAGVVQHNGYSFDFPHDLHPFTLSDLAYVTTGSASYSFYLRGEPASTTTIKGWLFRVGGPYNTHVATDSVAFVLRRL